MRRNDNIYEYIRVYVDDLIIAMKNPQILIKLLTETHQFKLKGTGEIRFLLGCNFFCNPDGMGCMVPFKYIGKIIK